MSLNVSAHRVFPSNDPQAGCRERFTPLPVFQEIFDGPGQSACIFKGNRRSPLRASGSLPEGRFLRKRQPGCRRPSLPPPSCRKIRRWKASEKIRRIEGIDDHLAVIYPSKVYVVILVTLGNLTRRKPGHRRSEDRSVCPV
jgi:hypothetical protein